MIENSPLFNNDTGDVFIDYLFKEYFPEEFDKKHNIKRDRRGRLNKGAKLAQKDNCNKKKILQLYCSGMRPKEIVNYMRCSKSTVYRVIKEYKDKMR